VKVLLVTGTLVGGAALQVAELASGLKAQGHDVLLVAPRGGPLDVVVNGEMADQVHWLDLPHYSLSPRLCLGALGAIRRQLRRFQPDVVHTNTMVMGVLARLAVVGSGTAVVHTQHTQLGSGSEKRLLRVGAPLVERMLARLTDVYVAPSVSVAESLRQLTRRPATTVVVPNFVECRVVAETIPDGAKGRELCFVGRFEKVKGPDQFLDFVRLWTQKHPDDRFTMIGAGSMGQEIENQLQNNGVHQVRMVGWLDSPASVMANSDALVVTSREESFGLVAVEAMHLGVPVFAIKVPGLVETLTDYSGASVAVVASDVEQLATVGSQFFESDERSRRSLIERAKAHAYTYSDIDAFVTAYVDVYDRAIAATG